MRELLRREPYNKLTIRLADGRAIEIPHPEFAYLPPSNKRDIVVYDQKGRLFLINLSVVVSVEVDTESADADDQASGAA